LKWISNAFDFFIRVERISNLYNGRLTPSGKINLQLCITSRMAFNFANVAEWEVKVAPVFATSRSSRSTGVNIRRRRRKNRDNGFSILVLPLKRGAREKNTTTNTQNRYIHRRLHLQKIVTLIVPFLSFSLNLSVHFLPLLSLVTMKEGFKFTHARYFEGYKTAKKYK